MTNEEYKIISEAIEKCNQDMIIAFDNFNADMKIFKLELAKKYPDAFISEQEAETHENN